MRPSAGLLLYSRQLYCFGTSNAVFLSVILFCRSRFTISVRIVLLLLMIATLAGRSEANCFPMASEPATQSEMMQDCADMAIGPVGSRHPEPLHHSDGAPLGMCHLGCPVLLMAAEEAHSDTGLLSPSYALEFEPMLVGISDIPQTPPPRFG